MRRLMLVLACLTAATVVAAQTPCDLPVTTVTVNPARFNMTSADHMTTILDTPEWLIASYEIRFYAEGAPAPFQTFTYPRAAWAPVTGAPNCYTIAQTSWPLTPNVRYRAVAVAKTNPLAKDAAGNPLPDSPPSEESNPFGTLASPRRPVTRVQ